MDNRIYNQDSMNFTAPSPSEPVIHNTDEAQDEADANSQITDNGSITINKDGHYIHCLTIIGQVVFLDNGFAIRFTIKNFLKNQKNSLTISSIL